MKKTFKEESSDNLIKQGINIICELSDRGINFFQRIVDTYNKLRKNARKVKKIIKDIKSNREEKP
ncbi:hypothetical protein ES703_33231 [subsurface metagenome]